MLPHLFGDNEENLENLLHFVYNNYASNFIHAISCHHRWRPSY